MKVLKRNGNIEDFDIEKIETVLSRVSDELQMPMTQGDIKNISESLVHTLAGKAVNSQVTYRDIHYCLVDTLKDFSFGAIADAINYSKKSKVNAS